MACFMGRLELPILGKFDGIKLISLKQFIRKLSIAFGSLERMTKTSTVLIFIL